MHCCCRWSYQQLPQLIGGLLGRLPCNSDFLSLASIFGRVEFALTLFFWGERAGLAWDEPLTSRPARFAPEIRINAISVYKDFEYSLKISSNLFFFPTGQGSLIFLLTATHITLVVVVCVNSCNKPPLDMKSISLDRRAVLIFDWDDTICPSSFVDKSKVETFDDLPNHVRVLSCLNRPNWSSVFHGSLLFVSILWTSWLTIGCSLHFTVSKTLYGGRKVRWKVPWSCFQTRRGKAYFFARVLTTYSLAIMALGSLFVSFGHRCLARLPWSTSRAKTLDLRGPLNDGYLNSLDLFKKMSMYQLPEDIYSWILSELLRMEFYRRFLTWLEICERKFFWVARPISVDPGCWTRQLWHWTGTCIHP